MSDRADRIKANEDALKARLAKLRGFSENVAARLSPTRKPAIRRSTRRGWSYATMPTG
jgi:hypothetical protein